MYSERASTVPSPVRLQASAAAAAFLLGATGSYAGGAAAPVEDRLDEALEGVSAEATPADEHTLALWLFDEREYPYATLLDAGTGMYDLRLMERGRLGPGRFGNALYLDGGHGHAVAFAGYAGKVVAKHLRRPDGEVSGLWAPTEGPKRLLDALEGKVWRCELWLRLLGSRAGTLVDLGQGYAPGFTVSLTEAGRFRVLDAYAGVLLDVSARMDVLADGDWHHVSFARNGERFSYRLDGGAEQSCAVERVARQPKPDLQRPFHRRDDHRGFAELSHDDRRLRRFNVGIGHERKGGAVLEGAVDELRFASRADAPAALTSLARKFGADGATPLRGSETGAPPLLFDGAPASGPLDFGHRKHLFVDDAILEERAGLRFEMHRPFAPRRINVQPENSAWRPSVVDVEGRVFLYAPEGYVSAAGRTGLFVSEDGVSFEPHRASPVLEGVPLYGTFFRDPNPRVRDEERFKLTAWVGNRGIAMFFSPDGLRWRRNETLMLPLVSGGGAETFFDDQRGRYTTLLKRDSSFRTPRHPGAGRRAVMFEAVEPLEAWPFERLDEPYFEAWTLPAVTGEGPVIFGVNESGQVYRTRAIKYPWAPDAYLAFVWRYPERDRGAQLARHVDLGVSRDGRSWKFFEPTQGWYIPPEGEDPEQLSLYGLVRRGDEIWQYTDHGGPHGGDAPRTYYRWSQRLDGFVSLSGVGTAVTRPLRGLGPSFALRLNSSGPVRVGVLDAHGRPLPGFGVESCDPAQDSVDWVVSWAGRVEVSAGPVDAVRLRFDLEDGDLYAFEIRKDVGH